MQKYNKAIIAVIAVVLTGLNIVFAKNDTVQLLIALATAAGVYQTPNE